MNASAYTHRLSDDHIGSVAARSYGAQGEGLPSEVGLLDRKDISAETKV
jgi:hypothetical protein